MSLLFIVYIYIFHNYILHVIFQYITSIKKYKQCLVILSHCQLYIKAHLSYILKKASWKPKRVVAMFF